MTDAATDAAGVEHIEGMVAALRGGDLDGLLGRLHPDVEVHEAASLPYGGIIRGREAFRDELIMTIMGLATLAIDTVRIGQLDDGRLIVEMDLAFTSRATGETLQMPVVEIYTIVDGLVGRIDVYYKDTKRLVEFLGTGGRSPEGEG